MKEKAEKLLAKAKATPAASKSSRESQLQAEVDKCMVRYILPSCELFLTDLSRRVYSSVRRARCACGAR
jgi:hypothetical protein